MLYARARRVATLGVVLASVLTGACSETRRPEAADAGDSAPPALTTGRRVTPAVAVEAGGDLPSGTRGWRLSRPARQGQIEGYTTTSSGLPGAPVALRVSTGAATYRVRAYRFGAYAGGDAHRVWVSPRLLGRKQPGATFADAGRRTVVAAWRTSTVVDTHGWAPGLYVLKLAASTGWQAHVPYVVSSPSAVGRTAVVFPVTTWQAYNDWGGYSLYEGAGVDRRSWAVSFDRPYPAPGATEMLFGAEPVAVAAERTGIPLAYFTNVDLDRRPDALAGATAYVSTGHDEYWTSGMRARVGDARAAGTNLAFLGANTMYWRVRLEDAGRVVVGYRSDASLDPAPRAQRTGQWRDAEGAEPENELTGMEYECFPVDAPFRVASPRWWGFAGTGTRAGEEMAHLVGIEADRVYPVASTPRPLEVLAHVSYSCRGVRTSAEATYYTTRSGAGVFNAGTLRWTCALAGRCPSALTRRTVRFVGRVTGTVLREFARGPAGRRHPAHDNVARFDLSPQNLVPAS
jgi:hypothetical protein